MEQEEGAEARTVAGGGKMEQELEQELEATFNAGASFHSKLRDSLAGLARGVGQVRKEGEGVRGEQEVLAREQEALRAALAREQEGRRAEVAGLEEKLWKEGRAREEEVGRLGERVGREGEEVREEVATLGRNIEGEVEGVRVELGALAKALREELGVGREELVALAREGREGREEGRRDMQEMRENVEKEREAREQEMRKVEALLERVGKEQEEAVQEVERRARGRGQEQEERVEELRKRMEQENSVLRKLAEGSLAVYFDALRCLSPRCVRCVQVPSPGATPMTGEARSCSPSTLSPVTWAEEWTQIQARFPAPTLVLTPSPSQASSPPRAPDFTSSCSISQLMTTRRHCSASGLSPASPDWSAASTPSPALTPPGV